MKQILISIFLIIMFCNFFVADVSSNIKKVNYTRMIIYNKDTINSFSYLKHPGKNQLFIEVIINGKKAYMILDTGATITVLDKTQLDDYDLRSFDDGSEYGGIGGTNTLYEVTNCNSIKIGNSKFNQKLYASDLNAVVEGTFHISHIRIVGILGSDFFSDHNAVFDYKNQVFFLTK